jgi:hypothetical protein
MEQTAAVVQYQGESERVNFHIEKGAIKKIEFLRYFD